jgi:exopolysaccharide biosynthesis polyprenyl glycosylphosphotransferase
VRGRDITPFAQFVAEERAAGTTPPPPPASAPERRLFVGEVVGEAAANGTNGAAARAYNRLVHRNKVMRRRESTFRRLLGFGDALAILITVAVAARVVGDNSLQPAALALPLVFVLAIKAIGLYDRDLHLLHKTTLDEIPRLFAVATTTTLLLYLADGLLVEGVLGRGQVAVAWATLFMLLASFRSLARGVATRVTAPERCLYVGDEKSANEFREKLATSHSINAMLVGWVPAGANANGGGQTRTEIAERTRLLLAESEVHRVVVGPGPERPAELLESIRRIAGQWVKVSVLPDVARLVNPSIELDRLNGITLLGLRRFEISRSSHVLKRAFDLLGATVGLLLTWPVCLLIAAWVRLDSPGPVLFRQPRAGRHGRPFEMLKFRSMHAGADAEKDALRHLNAADGVFKIPDDPRITRAGKVIRRLHLDELPQLINVLRGDMSLVGPRPLPLDEDRRIEGWHRRRLDLRPGITGPWQILGSARIPTSEMVQLDYQYVADWSVWNDLRILLLTVGHVIRRRGQ